LKRERGDWPAIPGGLKIWDTPALNIGNCLLAKGSDDIDKKKTREEGKIEIAEDRKFQRGKESCD